MKRKILYHLSVSAKLAEAYGSYLKSTSGAGRENVRKTNNKKETPWVLQ